MAILAVFSGLFFAGAAMALAGVAVTVDLLSGRSLVLARLIPSLRLLEQKKVRKTQQAAAQRAGVIKMVLLAACVLLALVGVGLAVTEMQRRESPWAMAAPPQDLAAEHDTVVRFLGLLDTGRPLDAARLCRLTEVGNWADGQGVHDRQTDAVLSRDRLAGIAAMQLADPQRGPLRVRLANGYTLTWRYVGERRPGDGEGGEPIELIRIEPPPPATRPQSPLPQPSGPQP